MDLSEKNRYIGLRRDKGGILMKKQILTLIVIIQLSFIISATRYYVSKEGSDQNSGSSWSNSFLTISKAINRSSTGSEIWVAEGTYQEGNTIVISLNKKLYGGFSGTESSLAERKADHETIIDGQALYRCVENHGTIENFTIYNGKSEENGGGVYNTATIGGCKINKCYGSNGGGIYNEGGIVDRCILENNSAEYGGGIFSYFNGIVQNTLIHSNIANESGDGLYNWTGSSINNTVYKNGITTGAIGIQNKSGAIINTISYGHSKDIYSEGADCNIKYSCFKESQGDNGNIYADPNFFNILEETSIWDFHLVSGSPCIGMAISEEAPQYDIENIERLSDQPTNIGAYERISPSHVKADFSADVTFSRTLIQIHFTDLSLGKISRYEWDFNSDGIIDSQEMNPVWMYQELGIYDVSLTVYNDTESDTITKEDFIELRGPWFVSTAGSDENDGKSWEKSFKTISYALTVAEYEDLIYIGKGNFNERISVPNGISIYGGFTGTETDLSERDIIENKTIIDGGNGGRCIYNRGTIDGLYVTNGHLSLDSSGAGIYNNSGIVNNCSIYSNSVSAPRTALSPTVFPTPIFPINPVIEEYTQRGAGIYNDHGKVTNSIIFNNKLYGPVTDNSFYYHQYYYYYYGAGIYNVSGTIENCDIYSNSSQDLGGGIYNSSGRVNNCTVRNNSSGIYGGSVTNSICWNNNKSDIKYGQVSYSCFREASGTGFNIKSDPHFDYGSNRPSYFIYSPCLDHANPDSCSAKDLLGNPRNLGDGPDIGAYEIDYTPSSMYLNLAIDKKIGVTPFKVQVINQSYGNITSWEWDFNNDGIIDSYDESPTWIYREKGVYSIHVIAKNQYTQQEEIVADSVRAVGQYYVKKDGSDSHNGYSWDGAFASIGHAVEKCNDGESIWIAAGVYSENEIMIPAQISVWGGFKGTEEYENERNIKGYQTIIDGKKEHRCIYNEGYIDGIFIRNGYSLGNGGGVYNCGIIKNSFIHKNVVGGSGNGGGVYNKGELITCAIYENTCINKGGAVYNEGRICRCSAAENSALLGGGAIYNEGEGSVIVNCVIFANESYEKGGGIYLKQGSLINATLYKNEGTQGGDGIFIEGGTVFNTISNGQEEDIFNQGGEISYSCYKEAAAQNNNISLAPLFESVSGELFTWNFKLQSPSPCIDTGTSVNAPEEDLFGQRRSFGKGVDMGANEYYYETAVSRLNWNRMQ